MTMRRQYQLLACTLALAAVLGFLSITSRTKPESIQKLKRGEWGSPEEAFTMASRTIDDYVSSLIGGPVDIDSQFKATLHSRSRIWTVKGYAYSAHNHQSYRWIVILDCEGVQDWEILDKITWPVSFPPVSEVEGFSDAEEELSHAHPNK